MIFVYTSRKEKLNVMKIFHKNNRDKERPYKKILHQIF